MCVASVLVCLSWCFSVCVSVCVGKPVGHAAGELRLYHVIFHRNDVKLTRNEERNKIECINCFKHLVYIYTIITIYTQTLITARGRISCRKKVEVKVFCFLIKRSNYPSIDCPIKVTYLLFERKAILPHQYG